MGIVTILFQMLYTVYVSIDRLQPFILHVKRLSAAVLQRYYYRMVMRVLEKLGRLLTTWRN